MELDSGGDAQPEMMMDWGCCFDGRGGELASFGGKR